MNKAEFLAAIKGKPTPFTTPSGATVQLRPISLPELIELRAWLEAQGKAEGAGQLLQERYFALGVCNGDGDPMFTLDEVRSVAVPAVDFRAIAEEVARRAGLGADDGPKESPATPS